MATPQDTATPQEKLRMFITDLAQDIVPLEELLVKYSYSIGFFTRVNALPAFQKRLSEERTAWLAVDNRAKRVKFQAGAAVENLLPELGGMFLDRTLPARDRLEAIKHLSKLAEFGGDKAATGGESVSIIINLGEDKKLAFSHALPEKVIEHSDA
jgi:hypothetical protein